MTTTERTHGRNEKQTASMIHFTDGKRVVRFISGRSSNRRVPGFGYVCADYVKLQIVRHPDEKKVGRYVEMLRETFSRKFKET